MHEQNAVLVQHQGEWIFAVDDDESGESVWQD
jgi:hypothetical protein